MKPRIYIFALLLFAFVALAPVLVKADAKGQQSDKKDKNSSDRNLPINTAIVALLVAGGGIGIIAIKKASVASRTI
jgi:hypothetical protein